MNKSRISRAVFALFAAQPLLDVLSYLTQGMKSADVLMLGLRMFLLAAFFVLGFVQSRRKSVYYCFAGAAVVFYLLHAGSLYFAGGFTLPALIKDATNYVRVLHLPMMALALCSIFAADKDAWNAALYGCLAALGIIALVMLISRLTGTDPTTYENKGIGVRGWFYCTNSQSAILTALVPLALYSTRKYGKLATAVTALLGSAMLFLYGTRLAYGGAIIILFGTLLFWAIMRKLDWKRATALLVCAVACISCLHISPMWRNQGKVATGATYTQQNIDKLLSQGHEDYPEDGDARALEMAYHTYMPGLVERFGIERVAEAYDYSTDTEDLCNARRMKRTYCELLLEDAPLSVRLFGLSYAEMYYAEENFDAENDFHGIFYLYGAVGLAGMIALFLYAIYRIVRALLRDFKFYFTPEAAACGIAFFMLALHCYFTAGVLRRPNASVYLSLALAGVWYLTRHERESAQ